MLFHSPKTIVFLTCKYMYFSIVFQWQFSCKTATIEFVLKKNAMIFAIDHSTWRF